jgi:L-lysine exporter family protein LysE/ArgO
MFLQGFLVGLAYVAPIGMQNAYVINSATKFTKMKALQVAFITIFFDISLALACFFGIGILLDRVAFLKQLIMIVGSVAVCYIGIMLMRSKTERLADTNLKVSLWANVVMCFTVTWLNPQALIDGTMLLSGFKASLGVTEGYNFIAGVALASATWFISLVFIVSRFKDKMTAQVLTTINRICGAVILIFGLKIGIQFLIN